jgi:hypothetical protein
MWFPFGREKAVMDHGESPCDPQMPHSGHLTLEATFLTMAHLSPEFTNPEGRWMGRSLSERWRLKGVAVEMLSASSSLGDGRRGDTGYFLQILSFHLCLFI